MNSNDRRSEQIRVAIVEDTFEDLEHFKKVFRESCEENQVNFTLSTFENGIDFQQSFHGQFDLIFLDIELPDGDGLEISRFIRTTDSKVILVFLTQMGQYAVCGYEVDAMDYMIKPVDTNVFKIKMKKILRRITENMWISDNISICGGKWIIKLEDIIYIDVYNHDVTYHIFDRKYTERGTLKEIEGKMHNAFFGRINNCYLVNYKHIVGIDKYDLHLDNGEILQISRRRKKELCDAFNRYLGGSR